MKAYILDSGIRISPFNDPPGRAFVLNRRAEERCQEILKRHGLEVVPIQSCDEIKDTEFFLFMDYVYFSPHCFHLFYKAVLRRRESRTMALRSNAQIEMVLWSGLESLRQTMMQHLHPFPYQYFGS